MSKFTRGSYPHPVLDAFDDVDAAIEVFNASYVPSVDDLEIKFQVRMTEPGIEALIREGKARYSFRWSCASTLTSGDLRAEVHMKHADSTGYIGWIDQEAIRGIVRVDIKIIACVPIDSYRLESQHPDYADACFHLLPGDIMADGGSFSFEADKLYDPLRPPVGSCFRFATDTTVKRGVQVRFNEDDHVLVAFPAKLLMGFGMLRDRQDLQIGLVVLPALMETISYIRENEAAGVDGEDLSDRRWYEAIRRLIEDAGSLEQSSFELAQRILGNPLDNSLTTLFDNLGES